MKISLSAARVNAGYQVKEACRFLGVTPQAMSLYESGARELKVSQLVILLDKYNIKFEELTWKTKEDYYATKKA